MNSPTEAVITRRRALQLAALAGVALGVPRRALAAGPAVRAYDDGTQAIPGGLSGTPVRVIVVGAGFAGLAAANALTNAGVDCVVLEGRSRIGGRAHTQDVGGIAIDVGCSWIHQPEGNPMTAYAEQAGVETAEASPELDVATIRFFDERAGGTQLPTANFEAFAHAIAFDEQAASLSRELGPRATVEQGARRYLDDVRLSGDRRRQAEFLIRTFVELSDAYDWERLSLAQLADYQAVYGGVGQGNFPKGGYRRLVDAMAAGLDVRLRQRVTAIDLRRGGVRVAVERRRGDRVRRRVVSGSHVLVTVPLGVLKRRGVRFSDGLPPAKRRAIRRLGFGQLEKVALAFEEPFWEAGGNSHLLHLAAGGHPLHFPVFFDYQRLAGRPALVGLVAASAARDLARRPADDVRETAMAVLRKVYGDVPPPTGAAVTNWFRDRWSCGSYATVPLGGSTSDPEQLGAPIAGRILFAGEATSANRYGYADGALSSGIREAKRLLRQPSVMLRA